MRTDGSVLTLERIRVMAGVSGVTCPGVMLDVGCGLRPAAPGPLEGYAARFGDPFGRLAQRRRFRGYLAGLPAARDRNKPLTVLVGAELVGGRTFLTGNGPPYSIHPSMTW